MRRPTALLVDTGIDDAGALMWAATAAEVDLVAAIATFGNCDAEQASRNTLAVLEAAGCTAPVHQGATGPLGSAPPGASAALLMGESGLGHGVAAEPAGTASGLDGAEALVELAHRHAGELDIVALAPLTTIALALQRAPELPGLINSCVVMGGAVACGGNRTAAAEANIANDPAAASAVVHAFGEPGALAGGAPPRLVPLDVTLAATLGDAELAAVERSACPGTAMLSEIWTSSWAMLAIETGGVGAAVHDLAAALALVEPDLFEWETLPLEVDDSGGPAWGATIADRRVRLLAQLDPETRAVGEAAMGAAPARWQVAESVDVERYRARVTAWLTDRATNQSSTVAS